jgi:serine/threonine-protein kinase
MAAGPILQTAAPRLVVLGKLAQGGMGAVWLAHPEGQPEQLVALKRMHKHLMKDASFLSMFLDEIWMTGALSHPNVVGLVGWGVDQQGPYFATELILGDSLYAIAMAGREAHERLSEHLIAYVAGEVARGLTAAYELIGDNGEPLYIIHRDLTPSNVLIGFDGSVKVSDFGVAKASSKIVETQQGILKGKAHFMAPEYVRGMPIDARSDLYSLGVVMFELISGQRPFVGSSDIDLLRRVAHDRARPLATVADVDAALTAIVDRLLSRAPEERFESGAALAAAIDAWLAARGHDRERCRAELAAYARRHGKKRLDEIERIRRAPPQRPSAPELLQPQHTTASSLSTRADPITVPSNRGELGEHLGPAGRDRGHVEPDRSRATREVDHATAPGAAAWQAEPSASDAHGGTPPATRAVPHDHAPPPRTEGDTVSHSVLSSGEASARPIARHTLPYVIMAAIAGVATILVIALTMGDATVVTSPSASPPRAAPSSVATPASTAPSSDPIPAPPEPLGERGPAHPFDAPDTARPKAQPPGGTAPSARPPIQASSARPVASASSHPTSSPLRRCTPADYDYPSCRRNR